MSNYLRLVAYGPQAPVYAYPERGFAKYGRGKVPPQPRDVAGAWTPVFAQVAKSRQNIDFLKQRIMDTVQGAVSDYWVLGALDKALSWYWHSYMEPTYGPSTPQQQEEAVGLINRWVINELQRQYASQRAMASRWVRSFHRPFGMDQGMPKYDSVFDSSIEHDYI